MEFLKSRLLRWLAGLVLLAVLLAVGYRWGRPAYRQWRHDRALAAAERFLAAGDLRNAALSTRQALNSRGDSLPAAQLMAEITERLRLPASLQWRQRVVELAPTVLSNRLAFVRAAVLAGDFPNAAESLAQVAATNNASAEFHEMAAIVQLGLNNLGAAEAHLTEALRLHPTSPLVRLNLAVIRLQAADSNVVAAARAQLRELADLPECRRDALRNLALAELRRRDFAAAAGFTREMQAATNAHLSERLLHLQVLKEGGFPEFMNQLAAVQRQCATNAESAGTLAGWMLASQLAAPARAWLAQLPTSLQSQPPVFLGRADCLLNLKDWAGLKAFLTGGDWSELEFMRLAMLSLALRESQQELQSQVEWRAALRVSTDRPKQLAALAQLAARWGWKREQEELLWTLVQRHPGERWALNVLQELLVRAGNTRSLYRLYGLLVERNPEDAVSKNNLASLSLLLNLQLPKAHQFAREAYTKATNNAAFASTYAYSLFVQGRGTEGLAVLDALAPAQLTNATIALYYGALQTQANPATAKKFLALAEPGPLLPEEKELLAEMRRRL